MYPRYPAGKTDRIIYYKNHRQRYSDRIIRPYSDRSDPYDLRKPTFHGSSDQRDFIGYHCRRYHGDFPANRISDTAVQLFQFCFIKKKGAYESFAIGL